MTWEDFYLVCFIAGFAFSVLSFFAGAFGLHLPDHADDGGGGFHLPQHHGDASAAPLPDSGGSSHISPFNISTIMAFLSLFGGTGYLLTHFSGLRSPLVLAFAFASGLAGAAAVFLYLARFLMAHDHAMKPADYDMTGILAVITSPVREGGTGEIVYSRDGVRRFACARSEDGKAVGRGEQVVVLRYERGIAYVCRWDELGRRPGSAPETLPDGGRGSGE